jgi:predicted nucleic acid-binding protein
MASRLRVLLDLNVILDVLAHRDSYYRAAAEVWAQAETSAIEGYVAAHSLTTLFYLVSRHADRQTAVNAVRDLTRVFAVAAVDHAVILRALDLDWPDFEDAVQMAAAAEAGVDYLVTRNTRDFRSGGVPVVTPAELLALVEAPSESAGPAAI